MVQSVVHGRASRGALSMAPVPSPSPEPEPEPRSLPQATDERHRRAREGKAAAAARTLCVSLREALRWQRAELASVRQQAGGPAPQHCSAALHRRTAAPPHRRTAAPPRRRAAAPLRRHRALVPPSYRPLTPRMHTAGRRPRRGGAHGHGGCAARVRGGGGARMAGRRAPRGGAGDTAARDGAGRPARPPALRPPALPPSRPPALAFTQPARSPRTLPPWRPPPPSCPRGGVRVLAPSVHPFHRHLPVLLTRLVVFLCAGAPREAGQNARWAAVCSRSERRRRGGRSPSSPWWRAARGADGEHTVRGSRAHSDDCDEPAPA